MTKWTEFLEAAITGKVISALIDHGYRVEVSDQDGGDGLFIYAAADGGAKPKDGFNYWVRLQPGNGADLIVDHTTNLEAVLKEVNAFAASWQD